MATETMTNKIVELEVDSLFPHPDNPRKSVGDVTELAESIKQSGVMQNLTVVPKEDKYTVIIGHRRLAAAKKAGLKTVPCAIVNLTPQEQIATMLFENMQRTDLTPREQAEGIQMMLDFGESIESVSQKTGLSESTVRRRVSLAKLNPKKMEAAQNNGATLEQFMKVSELKLKSAQNEVMDAIGTDNFNAVFKKKMNEQKVAENMPKIRKELSVFATEDPNFDTWDRRYTEVKRVSADKWKPGDFKIKVKKGKKYVWKLSLGDSIILCIKEEVKEAEKPTQNKISDQEKEARRRRRELRKASEFAYELRCDFIKNFSAGKLHQEVLNRWLAEMCIYNEVFSSGNFDKKLFREAIGQAPNDYWIDEKLANAYFENNPSSSLAMLVYCYSGDNQEQRYYSEGCRDQMPYKKENKRLDIIYKYLAELGYTISDGERELMDGTHPLLNKESIE